jgi:two-component system alkaline phosphatase synthesis response regulator PhoP
MQMTASRKSRILIADDNGPNVELLEAYLTGLDCEIAIAVDGRDTLDKVASFKPHLILLDVMMPKLSGFEVCKKLRQDAATKDIMVLMVTALNELGDIERAVQAGTDDFLSKPVNKLELLKRVENMLKLRHVQDELERLRQYIAEMDDSAGPQASEDRPSTTSEQSSDKNGGEEPKNPGNSKKNSPKK